MLLDLSLKVITKKIEVNSSIFYSITTESESEKMKNNLLKLGVLISILSLNYLYSNNINYVIPIQSYKQQQINKSLLLQQYIYDLKKLNEILKNLYNNDNFKFASQTAELEIKNIKSYYSYDYIENLIKVLNGVDPYDDYHILNNQGYIKYIEDIYTDNYKMYENNKLNNLISTNLDYIKKDITHNLQLLSINLKKEDDIKPYLKNIFNDLIISLEEIKKETIQLKKSNIIKPFNKIIDYKYKMPTNWAQYRSTLIDILNFILNGAHKKSYLGIKDYYHKFYFNDTQGFKIIQ
jgi:hypothetical protein